MSHRAVRRRTVADWVTFVASAFVVGALVAVALIEEVRRGDEDEPGVAVTFLVGETTVRDGSYYVPYSVRNTGDTGIEAAEIWIEVFNDEQMIESDEIRVEFIPLEGTQDGVYVSQFDPSEYHYRGRLESLSLP